MTRMAMKVAKHIIDEDMGVKKAYEYAFDNYPQNYHGPGKCYTRKDWVLIVMEQVNEMANILYNN